MTFPAYEGAKITNLKGHRREMYSDEDRSDSCDESILKNLDEIIKALKG